METADSARVLAYEVAARGVSRSLEMKAQLPERRARGIGSILAVSRYVVVLLGIRAFSGL